MPPVPPSRRRSKMVPKIGREPPEHDIWIDRVRRDRRRVAASLNRVAALLEVRWALSDAAGAVRAVAADGLRMRLLQTPPDPVAEPGRGRWKAPTRMAETGSAAVLAGKPEERIGRAHV